MTQEDLAEKMNISRQTVSKWELDTVQPEMDKAIELCRLFNCTLDNLFRDDMAACGEAYTHLRVEVVPAYREIYEQAAHKYAAIHIEKPFENPFVTIPNAYKTLMEYMRVNGLEHTKKDVIPCFETDGENLDDYIACK